MDEILKILNNWDPIELLPMAPENEYFNEAKKIFEIIYNKKISKSSLAFEINKIFVNSFGADIYKEDMKNCEKTAGEILAVFKK